MEKWDPFFKIYNSTSFSWSLKNYIIDINTSFPLVWVNIFDLLNRLIIDS